MVTLLKLPKRLERVPVTELIAALGKADAQHEPVMLTGGEGVFCDGMSFTEVLRPEHSEQDLRAALQLIAELFARLLRHSAPSLALVDGTAIGGGLGLAAACDVVIATPRARFALPEALVGLSPAIIRPALLTRLTPQQLRLLLFTGYSRSATESVALGLVDQLVEPEDLERAGNACLRQVRRAQTATVSVVRCAEHGNLDRELEEGIGHTLKAILNADVRRNLRAAEEAFL